MWIRWVLVVYKPAPVKAGVRAFFQCMYPTEGGVECTDRLQLRLYMEIVEFFRSYVYP